MKISAVILAGGKSRRFNKQDKGLLKINGLHMVNIVVKAIDSMTDEIIVSANRNQDIYRAITKLPVISDNESNYLGPLHGIMSAFEVVQHEYLLVVPCDAPNIKPELLSSLKNKIGKHEIAVAHDGERYQYTFALMKVSLLNNLKAHILSGGQSLGGWYKTLDKTSVNLPKKMFFNMNTINDYCSLVVKSYHKKIPVLGFVGFSGAGKTTLLEQVIKFLSDENINVAVIKHSHHKFDMDTPGKDSHRFRLSGAKQVMLGSSQRYALLVENQGKEPNLGSLISKLDMSGLDLILFEGFKHEDYPKLEVNRLITGNENLFKNDPSIIALVTDDLHCDIDVPLLDINNPLLVAQFVKSYLS